MEDLYSIRSQTLVDLADAIRIKTGETSTIKPKNMAEKINTLKKNKFMYDLIERDITDVTAEDLDGATKIGVEAFAFCSSLKSLEIPASVKQLDRNFIYSCSKLTSLVIPATVEKLEEAAFANAHLTSLTILKEDSYLKAMKNATEEGALTVWGTSARKIYVSGKLYDDYMKSKTWELLTNSIVPYDEYVYATLGNKVMAFNQVYNLFIPFTNFDYVPEYNISTEATNVSIENVSATAEGLTLDICSSQTEGSGEIAISISRADGHTFNLTQSFAVFESIPESTYEVVPVDGATYGFVLNDAGYWESTNQKKGNTASLCQVNISNPVGRTLHLDCINYAEGNYDYGIFSTVNGTLLKTQADDTANKYFTFKGKQSPNIQTVTYHDAIGDCFIQIKFRKDGSGDQQNDSLQFKVRFEE